MPPKTGQDASDEREEGQREGEDNERNGCLSLCCGFEVRSCAEVGRYLPDTQERHHQFPSVVGERAAKLGDQQAAEGMGNGMGVGPSRGCHS